MQTEDVKEPSGIFLCSDGSGCTTLIGKDEQGNTPFRIDSEGNITASSGTITGTE